MTTTKTAAVGVRNLTPCFAPRGAVSAEEWQAGGDGRFDRNFEGENREVAAGTKYSADVSVVAQAVQHDDGHIEGGDDRYFDAPEIIIYMIDARDGRPVDIGITLAGQTARQLADILVTAADEIDGWAAK